MSKYDLSDLMEQVQKAIESVDYKKLNEDISETIHSAVSEVKKSFNIPNNMNRKDTKDIYEEDDSLHGYKDYKEVNDSGKAPDTQSANKNDSKEKSKYFYKGEAQYTRKKEKNRASSYKDNSQTQYVVPAKNIGSVSGVLMTVFGSIGGVSFGLPLLICSVMWLAEEFAGSDFAVTAAVLIPFFITSLILFTRGICLNMRVSRFKKYLRRIGNKSVCSIQDLASTIQKPENYVVKDLRKMIHIGMFPEGHMDEQQKCFIADHKTYDYYLESKQQLEQRLREEEQQAAEQKKREETEDPKQKELRFVIETGRNYVAQIREVNDALPEEEISKKLNRMETIITQIFACIEVHPEKLPDITKFLDYYMPTTIKLVHAYRKLEHEPIQTENIVSSKQEIRQILDTINEAFQNLMNSLYDDMAMDISADISVLKTMLRQEGLTGRDFDINNNN